MNTMVEQERAYREGPPTIKISIRCVSKALQFVFKYYILPLRLLNQFLVLISCPVL